MELFVTLTVIAALALFVWFTAKDEAEPSGSNGSGGSGGGGRDPGTRVVHK